MSGFYAEIEAALAVQEYRWIFAGYVGVRREAPSKQRMAIRRPVIAGAKRPRQRIAEPRLTAPDRSGSPGKGAVKRRPPEIG
jgi:hypothetical protein